MPHCRILWPDRQNPFIHLERPCHRNTEFVTSFFVSPIKSCVFNFFRRKQTADPSNLKRNTDTADSFASDISESTVDGEMAVQQAWAELAEIEKEQDKWHDERLRTEADLEQCRQHGVALEDELPARISTDDERELLALLCRVHELEADKLALQGERIARMHELKRRDTALLRCERQRQISDAIITRQRQIMEGK